ncbi:MAG: hypothetical protein M9935_00775 [Kiritimatiellae bacterium]|nr:hypothetical protein [Kiritimatiellia bacterium]
MESPVELARKHAERSVYTLGNSYTTIDEKLEIESWYQLPLELAGHTYLITTIFWALGTIGGFVAYVIAVAVGILSAIFIWVAYSRAFIPLFMVVRLPYIGWFVHLGVAVWLGISGHWLPCIFVVLNRLLFFMPVSFPAMITNQVLTAGYQMHPKYAFLKHFYGKQYPFEE